MSDMQGRNNYDASWFKKGTPVSGTSPFVDKADGFEHDQHFANAEPHSHSCSSCGAEYDCDDAEECPRLTHFPSRCSGCDDNWLNNPENPDRPVPEDAADLEKMWPGDETIDEDAANEYDEVYEHAELEPGETFPRPGEPVERHGELFDLDPSELVYISTPTQILDAPERVKGDKVTKPQTKSLKRETTLNQVKKGQKPWIPKPGYSYGYPRRAPNGTHTRPRPENEPTPPVSKAKRGAPMAPNRYAGQETGSRWNEAGNKIDELTRELDDMLARKPVAERSNASLTREVNRVAKKPKGWDKTDDDALRQLNTLSEGMSKAWVPNWQAGAQPEAPLGRGVGFQKAITHLAAKDLEKDPEIMGGAGADA